MSAVVLHEASGLYVDASRSHVYRTRPARRRVQTFRTENGVELVMAFPTRGSASGTEGSVWAVRSIIRDVREAPAPGDTEAA